MNSEAEGLEAKPSVKCVGQGSGPDDGPGLIDSSGLGDGSVLNDGPSLDEVPQTAPVSTPVEPEFEGQADLDRVDALIAQTHFGQTSIHIAPFTAQLRASIKNTFEVDADIYAVSDDAIQSVQANYVRMRGLTLTAFIVNLVLVSSMLHAGNDSISNLFVIPILADWFAIWPRVGDLPIASYGYSLALTAALVIARLLVREWHRRSIEFDGLTFAYRVKARNDEILSKLDRCTRYAGLEGEDRAERSKKWTKIALWCSKRSEYLDRYTTTLAWKAQDTLKDVQSLTVVLKLGLLIYVASSVILIFDDNSERAITLTTEIYRLGFVAIFIPSMVYCWHYLHWFQRNIWNATFSETVDGEDAYIGNFYDDISDMVESFARQVDANRFNGK